MKYFAFGIQVPESIIIELIDDGVNEADINTDFLESYLWYDYLDNLD